MGALSQHNQNSCEYSVYQWYGGRINCFESTPYEIVFSEEFDSDTLNGSDWVTYYPYTSDGSDQCEFCRTHGEEGQIYTDDNVHIENGMLILTAKEEVGNWCSANRNYSSGMIHSTKQFLYGRFEMRCKLPQGSGFWPAFWLFNDDELDVMEYCGHNVGSFSTNLHMDCENVHYQISQAHGVSDISKDYHVFSVDWEPFYVEWSIDDEVVRRLDHFITLDQNLIMCGEQIAVNTLLSNNMIPNEPMNVIANLAISPQGSYCGDNTLSDASPLPSSFDIDYIRVFQKDIPRGLIGFQYPFIDLTIYSNPIINDVLHLHLGENRSGPSVLTVQIITCQGTILKETINVNTGLNEINLIGISNGLYIVSIYIDEILADSLKFTVL